jgi:hypothetical protein
MNSMAALSQLHEVEVFTLNQLGATKGKHGHAM